MRKYKKDDLLREVLERATGDRAFRARLLSNPASAIRNEFGVIFPRDYRIKFIERPRDVDALVVLPDVDCGELDEGELEQVAGGGETDTCGSW